MEKLSNMYLFCTLDILVIIHYILREKKRLNYEDCKLVRSDYILKICLVHDFLTIRSYFLFLFFCCTFKFVSIINHSMTNNYIANYL